VHRAAHTVGGTGVFAKEFGHEFVDVETTGNSMTMITVMREDMVLGLQIRNRADAGGFFTDIEMQKPTDFGAGVHLLAFFFKTPNQHHLAVKFDQLGITEMITSA
jgi:hypothetical protein